MNHVPTRLISKLDVGDPSYWVNLDALAQGGSFCNDNIDLMETLGKLTSNGGRVDEFCTKSP